MPIAVFEEEETYGLTVSADGCWPVWSQIDRNKSDSLMVESFG